MAEKFIKKAIKKPGALKKTLGVSKKTGKIPVAKVKAAAKKGNSVTAKRARLALTLSKLRKKK